MLERRMLARPAAPVQLHKRPAGTHCCVWQMMGRCTGTLPARRRICCLLFRQELEQTVFPAHHGRPAGRTIGGHVQAQLTLQSAAARRLAVPSPEYGWTHQQQPQQST